MDYEGAKELIRSMIEFLRDEAVEIADGYNDDYRKEICQAIDNSLQAYFNRAFSPPYKGKEARSRIFLGMDLLRLQLSSKVLDPPYNTVPRPTLLSALKALTGINEVKQHHSVEGYEMMNTDEAYRILQRLVSGIGVRNASSKKGGLRLYESDFNLVLNAYSNVGRMDMAHRIVALQERAPHAPALSPVAYSILLKGYGKLSDLNNVEMLLSHAEANKIEPDTIMLNSLLDAYINCDVFERARAVFTHMTNPIQENRSFAGNNQILLFKSNNCYYPHPNKRTYNIYLKGLANNGLLEEALKLTSEMRDLGFWDHVTTNTLVLAAVKASDFVVAEKILADHTTIKPESSTRHHPNVEAYTSVIDGYAKVGEIAKGIGLLKLMKKKDVQPNEYTYTCIVGALARSKKIEQAKKMIRFMKSEGLRVNVVTYNALISGLVYRKRSMDGEEFDQYVDAALNSLKQMMSEGVKPDAVTISVIVDAFGKCDTPRLSEAISLIHKLESDGIIAANNTRISTALVQVYGAWGDMEGAMQAFRRIKKPDVASINALLDACVRSSGDRAAMKTFEHYFTASASKLRPDVISYSIVIGSLLPRQSYFETSKTARHLYEEMKFKRRIRPDKTLIDIILKAMIENGKSGGLFAADVRFIASVLRDAEKLKWGDGQLERRKRAVQTIMTGRIAETWEEEADLFGLRDVDEEEDELFKRKGWNKVDSGFRLWGANRSGVDRKNRKQDAFFRSKGWNDVDSGFRII